MPPDQRKDDPPPGPGAAGMRDEAPVDALIDIALAQHAGFRVSMPALIARAAAIEPGGGPQPLTELLREIAASQEEHMLREELRVFPLMRQGRSERLSAAIALMREEHDDNVEFLMRLAQLTNDYRGAEGDGAARRALCIDVGRFAEDFIAHIYVEEGVLFPRFAASSRRPQRS